MQFLKIIECPRDAMQGIHEFIPTERKVSFINSLLDVGFDTIDVGSFVSPKAIPQLRDTAQVLNQLKLNNKKSKLLVIVANIIGAKEAIKFEAIDFIGFPFSVSETFQQLNTNSSILESLKRVKEIQELCINNNKTLVVYISMAFGNPYGDVWNRDIVVKWMHELSKLNIKIIALADTIGVSNSDNIEKLFSSIIPEFPQIEIGAHLHTTADSWKEKLQVAFDNGCRRFDSAIRGYGGCPMAQNKLVGNMPTENLIDFFNEKNILTGIDQVAFDKSMSLALTTFP